MEATRKGKLPARSNGADSPQSRLAEAIRHTRRQIDRRLELATRVLIANGAADPCELPARERARFAAHLVVVVELITVRDLLTGKPGAGASVFELGPFKDELAAARVKWNDGRTPDLRLCERQNTEYRTQNTESAGV